MSNVTQLPSRDPQRIAEIAAEVATWPPLTPAQRDRLRTVFAGRKPVQRERRAA